MNAIAVLEYIVKSVIPERCRSAKADSVREFYQHVLKDPESVISECKGLVNEWVIANADEGKLRDSAELKRRAVTQFNRRGAVYVICLIVGGELWVYSGQATDAWKRIADGHNRASYRSLAKRSFLYWLWAQATDVWICIAANSDRLVAGVTLNVMEQWMSVIFLGLQKKELLSNLPPAMRAQIPEKELEYGAGIREPLAEGFRLCDFPMKGSPFEQSQCQLRRNFFKYKKSLPTPDRAGPFLRGELFDGDFHPHGQQYRFHLGRLQFEIKRAFVDSLKPDTIWVRCDLAQEGSIHPNEVVKGEYNAFVVWDDPARRLAVSLGGLRRSDERPDETWVIKGGDVDIWTAKMNFLVDWLEGRDLTQDRPRRWYPGAEGSRGKGTFTRHPVDFLMDSGEDELFDDWDVHVGPKEYKAWYDSRKV